MQSKGRLVGNYSAAQSVASTRLLAFALGLAFGFEGDAPGAAAPVVLNIALAIAVMAGATMVVGNLVAISQSNIKRMLGYSSTDRRPAAAAGLKSLLRAMRARPSRASPLRGEGWSFYI